MNANNFTNIKKHKNKKQKQNKKRTISSHLKSLHTKKPTTCDAGKPGTEVYPFNGLHYIISYTVYDISYVI